MKTDLITLTAYERKNYVMKDKRDFVILSKIKKLETSKLSAKDKEIVKLIRTQLKKEWRNSLIIYLNRLARRYS